MVLQALRDVVALAAVEEAALPPAGSNDTVHTPGRTPEVMIMQQVDEDRGKNKGRGFAGMLIHGKHTRKDDAEEVLPAKWFGRAMSKKCSPHFYPGTAPPRA